jgi:hypothetical protein
MLHALVYDSLSGVNPDNQSRIAAKNLLTAQRHNRYPSYMYFSHHSSTLILLIKVPTPAYDTLVRFQCKNIDMEERYEDTLGLRVRMPRCTLRTTEKMASHLLLINIYVCRAVSEPRRGCVCQLVRGA